MNKSFSYQKIIRQPRTAQAGAAMVESILILSLMVVLLTAIPSIAKRQDIRQTTVDANRYATWEMTVSSTADRELVIDRFYSKPDASIRSAQSELNENNYWKDQNTPLVREHAFTAAGMNPLSKQSGDSHSLVDSRSLNLEVFERAAEAGLVAETITGTVRKVSGWTGQPEAIAPNRGIVQTALSVAVGKQRVNGENQPIGCDGSSAGAAGCLSISSAILVDAWEAPTDVEVKEATQVMVPTKFLKPIGKVFDNLSFVPLLKEFEDMDDNFGCVNTSLLPTKELTGNISNTIGNPNEC